MQHSPNNKQNRSACRSNRTIDIHIHLRLSVETEMKFCFFMYHVSEVIYITSRMQLSLNDMSDVRRED